MAKDNSTGRNDMIEEICGALKELRLTFVMSDLMDRMQSPGFEAENPVEVIHGLVITERERRRTNRFQDNLKRSGLKYPQATLDDSVNDPDRRLDAKLIAELSECGWVKESRNLIITGLTGAGKTYMACALAVCALTQRRTACYRKASSLLHKLVAAEADNTIDQTMETFQKPDVLIIDDFGLHKLDVDECRNLFEIIDARHENKATVIVSQLPVKSWYDTFSNAVYAEAVLDRLTHRAYRLEMNGASMRRMP